MAIARLIGLILVALVTYAIGSGNNAIAAVAATVFFRLPLRCISCPL